MERHSINRQPGQIQRNFADEVSTSIAASDLEPAVTPKVRLTRSVASPYHGTTLGTRSQRPAEHGSDAKPT